MTDRNGQVPEAEAPRERVSSLSAAILRIRASLDVETVLRAVVESARALTGAQYGVIATSDEAGRPQEHVISWFAAEDAQQVGGGKRRVAIRSKGHSMTDRRSRLRSLSASSPRCQRAQAPATAMRRSRRTKAECSAGRTANHEDRTCRHS